MVAADFGWQRLRFRQCSGDGIYSSCSIGNREGGVSDGECERAGASEPARRFVGSSGDGEDNDVTRDGSGGGSGDGDGCGDGCCDGGDFRSGRGRENHGKSGGWGKDGREGK